MNFPSSIPTSAPSAPPRESPFLRATQLDFLLALFRPFLTKQEAAFLLDDCHEDYIVALLDLGKLRAINIASEADGPRRELRIYRYTVEHLILAPKLPLGTINADAFVPHHRPTLLLREAASILACTERHIRNLNLDGPDAGRVRIHRQAFTAFLTTREITP